MSRLEDLIKSHSDTQLVHLYSPADYNPQTAHDYYERHKKLKGRQKTAVVPPPVGRQSHAKVVLKKHASAKVHPPVKSEVQRKHEVEARVRSLTAKLARLNQILQKLVKEAKARSGVTDTTATDSTKKDASGKSPSDSKLTPQQKQEAAKRSKEYRDKHKPTADEQAKVLEQKIADITQKIHDMKAQIAEARAAATRSSSSVGARAKPTK